MKLNCGRGNWVGLLKSAWENDIEFIQGIDRHLSDDDIARIWHDIETKETISIEFAKKIGEAEVKRCKDEWKKIKVAFHDKIHIMGNGIRNKFFEHNY